MTTPVTSARKKLAALRPMTLCRETGGTAASARSDFAPSASKPSNGAAGAVFTGAPCPLGGRFVLTRRRPRCRLRQKHAFQGARSEHRDDAREQCKAHT